MYNNGKENVRTIINNFERIPISPPATSQNLYEIYVLHPLPHMLLHCLNLCTSFCVAVVMCMELTVPIKEFNYRAYTHFYLVIIFM